MNRRGFLKSVIGGVGIVTVPLTFSESTEKFHYTWTRGLPTVVEGESLYYAHLHLTGYPTCDVEVYCRSDHFPKPPPFPQFTVELMEKIGEPAPGGNWYIPTSSHNNKYFNPKNTPSIL